ncbi:MAG: D-glycero-beta-D-manno-heptose-7-phosphate kinase [Bryobacteraceae bacterium]
MTAPIEKFRSARVLVIGDVMLDEYVVGAVSRICPEAPVPVLDVRSRYSSAGGAANVAMNIAGLGASVDLVGLAGDDAAGRLLLELLQRESIPVRGLVDAGDRGTISKTRIVAGQQQICRIDHETKSDVPAGMMDRLIDVSKELMVSNSIVVLSDYAKGILTERFCHEIISFARAAGKAVIVDPKCKSFSKYLGCTVITPNVAEASVASGIEINSEHSLHEAGNALVEQLPGSNVLITRGPEGMALFESGSEAISIPTEARRVFDVTGAGDTVVATLAVALAGGLPLREAVGWANVAAGIVVEKPGTATVSLEELFSHHENSKLARSLE